MSALQARPYQDRMITNIRRAVQQGKRRILVVLPTGGGKSVVAASIMQLTAAKGNESIFFASQRELITQIGNQLAKIDVPSRTIMAGVKEADGFEDRVDVLCSLVARDTLWQRAFKRNKMELPKADVMQIDECVTGDSLIQTLHRGIVQIKDISVGDVVLSKSVHGDCWRAVTATFDRGPKQTVVVKTTASQIVCTPDHEILVQRGIEVPSWRYAATLKEGDIVFSSGRDWTCSDTVTAVMDGRIEPVYDITVEGTHCFYANGILVHNCHQVGCPTYVSIMEAYEESIIIGWTATPCRSDNRPLGMWFDTMVQGATYKELQDGGYLVPVKVIAPDRPDLQGCKVSRGDYAKGDLQKRMNRDEMVGNIVKEWLRHGQGRSTVLFAAGVDHSIHCRDIFRKEGITAEHVDGKMPTEERDDIMARARDGKVRVVCNYGVLHTGVDVPNWKVMICARPTKSFGLFRQMAGRIQRPYAGHDHCCIARGQKVLTNLGEVAIQDVTKSHLVWDGVEFVSHEGAVRVGVKDVIEWDGLTATPDHKVLTENGWETMSEANHHGRRIVKSGVRGVPVGVLDHSNPHRARECSITQGRGSLQGMWTDFDVELPQPKAWRKNGLYAMQEHLWGPCSRMDLSESTEAVEKVQRHQEPSVSEVRSERDRVPIRLGLRSDQVDCGEHRRAGGSLPDARPDRQRRSLRTWEYPLGNCFRADEKPEQVAATELATPKVFKSIPARHIREELSRTSVQERTDGGADRSQVAQETAEVWDILNAGPRSRFTASNCLVANCILDHSDNTLHFGFPDEDVEWEIDGECDQAKKHMERKKHEPGEKGSDPYACEKCHTLYRGYACPACGHKPEKKGNEIKMSSGELKELERARANRKASPMDKQKHWDKCMGIAIQKGMKIGAAAHMYKEHFGVFPASSVQNVPRSSQWKMTAKDFYMQVVRPEKKAAEREIQTSLLW